MRGLRVAVCSPGITRGAYRQTYGLRFLCQIIQRARPDTEFYEIDAKSLHEISPASMDVALVSILGPDAALEYARAVKFRKPALATIIGGPGMAFPLMFCEVADAVMMGRGEGHILRAICGDYDGMCTKYSGTREGSVVVYGAQIIDEKSAAVGCRTRCSFCQYSWLNQYATHQARPSIEDLSYRSLNAPGQELMLKDLSFSMLTKNRFHPVIAGLDICQPGDQKVICKPTSFALLRSVMTKLAKDAEQQAAAGRYHMRLYTIAGYPWHRGFTAQYIRDCMNPQTWPRGVSLEVCLGLSHFAPMIGTPLECAAVSTLNMRDELLRTGEQWHYPRQTGPYVAIPWRTVPTPRIAVTQTILQRCQDPGQLANIARAKRWEDLADGYSDLLGWLDRMPAPWIRRVNDPRKKVERIYAALAEIRPDMHLQCPVYPEIRSLPDLWGVPEWVEHAEKN